MRLPTSLLLASSITLAALAACSSADDSPSASSPTDSPDGSAPDGSVAGSTRISVRTYEAADGTVVHAGLFDKKLGVPCVPKKLAGSSQLHCVPYIGVITARGSTFADSACSQAAALNPKGSCAATPYAVEGAIFPCDDHTVHRVEEKVAKGYRKDDDGKCIEDPFSPFVDVRRLGAPMAPSEFVAFTLAKEVLAGGVAVQVLVGDDGSRVVVTSNHQDPASGMATLFDTARNADCTPRIAADGVPRCLPLQAFEPYAGTGQFSKADCTGELGRPTICRTPVPKSDRTVYAKSLPATGAFACEGLRQDALFTAVPISSGTYYEKDTNDVCKTIQSTEPIDIASAGTSLPPDGFPKIEFGKVSSGSRLAVSGFSVGGKLVEQHRVRDQQLNVDCIFRPAADGVVRCLPVPMVENVVFTDDKCTAKAAVPAAQAIVDCNDMKFMLVGRGDIECGDERSNVLSLGEKVESAKTKLYALNANGQCEQQTDLPPFVYPIGDEVPPTQFVEAKTVDR